MRRSTKKTDDGRVAVMQLRHRVEKVGDKARATTHGFRRKVRRCNASRGPLSANEQILAEAIRYKYLCPIENTIPRCSSSCTASSTPLISGAAVMMRTPRGASLSISQSSLVARFSTPYISSNDAKPCGGDRICRGACAPLFASCMKGPSACHPRKVAPLGFVQGRRRESKVG